jgi:Cu/Ag efflux protein CusF
LASNEILVKHEPIPEYRDENGAIVGMAAMTMPFYLAKSVSLHGIKAGDAVELVVEQHIRPKFSDQVVSIHKLDSLRRAQ